MKFIKQIPLLPLAVIAIMMAVAPISSQPHLFEKLDMLANGSLSRPIDIFDLFMHGTPLVLLIIKLYYLVTQPATK